MFTGYVGLKFYSHEDAMWCLITQVNKDISTIKVVPATREYIPNRIRNKDLEDMLNNQGKAPKRIQYEVYLNAYYKHTDNAIDKMDARYYSLDKLLADWHNPPCELGDRLYYAPTCKLPSKYLPTQVGAVDKLNTLWCSPCSKWSYKRHIVYDIVDNAVGCLSSNETYWEYTGYNSIDKASLMIGVIKKNYPEHHVLALACKVSIANVTAYQDNIPLMDVEEATNTIEDELFGDDGRIGLFEDLEPLPIEMTDSEMYQVVSGNSYITTHQLDLTHYPILQPPVEGDELVSNYLFYAASNRILYADDTIVTGMWYVPDMDVMLLLTSNLRCVTVPCCNIFK